MSVLLVPDWLLELELLSGVELLELGVVDCVDLSFVPPAELAPLGATAPPAVLLPDWPLLLFRSPPGVLVEELFGVVVLFMVPLLLVPLP